MSSHPPLNITPVWTRFNDDLIRLVDYVPPAERGPAYDARLWDDLRPAEAARLDELLDGVYDLDDGSWREITLKVNRSDAEVRVRKGYFAVKRRRTANR